MKNRNVAGDSVCTYIVAKMHGLAGEDLTGVILKIGNG